MEKTYTSVADVMAVAGRGEEILVQKWHPEGNAAAIGMIGAEVGFHVGQ